MALKLYDIRFRRLVNHWRQRAFTWQRWATDAQEARTSAIKALYWEHPEGFRIVSVEEA